MTNFFSHLLEANWWVQLHKEWSPGKVFFFFSKRGLLKEYQTNLIAEKELLNGPTGRTMLCSSTHHLKYLSFWIEILSFSFFLSITYFFKLWKKCVYILCLYLVIMWKSGLQLVLRIYAPLPWPLIYTGGILHLPDNDQHLYFFSNKLHLFQSWYALREKGRKFFKLSPVPAFCPFLDSSFSPWKSLRSCFLTETRSLEGKWCQWRSKQCLQLS